MIRIVRPAMNTVFGVTLPEDAARLDRLAAEEALLHAERLERSLSRFLARSDVSRINAAAGRHTVPIEPETFALLAEVQRLVALVDGAFDPTVGPLMDLWRGRSEPPDESAVGAAAGLVGMAGLQLDADSGQAGLLCAGMGLDLGGVGKGYAVRCVAEELRGLGVTRALVDGGTSSAEAIGAQTIGIGEPHSDGPPLMAVPLVDQGAAVSAVRGSGFSFAGRFYGHIIDPRTGWPSLGPHLAAVIAPDPVTAEVLSTALLVAGLGLLGTIDQRVPGAAALLIGDDEPRPRCSASWPDATLSS